MGVPPTFCGCFSYTLGDSPTFLHNFPTLLGDIPTLGAFPTFFEGGFDLFNFGYQE